MTIRDRKYLMSGLSPIWAVVSEMVQELPKINEAIWREKPKAIEKMRELIEQCQAVGAAGRELDEQLRNWLAADASNRKAK